MSNTTGSRSAEKVNIPKDHDDPHFRYRREVAKVEHRSKNGGSTVLSNAASIAGDLGRTLPELQKHLRRSLRRRVSVVDGTKLSFVGRLSCDEIDASIEAYVVSRVLCPVCTLPETQGEGKSWCRACGWSGTF